MSEKLTESVIKLIEGKNFGHLATLMGDGSPQVTPVWVDREGDYLLVNTVEGRVKQRNVSRNPRVALDVYDQNNPYQMATIRGKVVAQNAEGADSHIDKLAKKYLGKDKYPWMRSGERRIIIKIKPESVTSF